MLVYGDHKQVADPRERLDRVAEQLARVGAMPPGIDRHARLVGALIEAGQLLQGVADAEAPTEPLDNFVHSLAQAVVRSHDSEFAEVGEMPRVPTLDLPHWIELRLPEGFAFYAVYPEAYIAAARRLRLSGPPRVIGIRSIGTTLGAVVAAALGAPPAITVRPFGDPFARQVELPAVMIERDAHYIIVDEGPGLSGSSFGSVADWLEQRDVPLERIAFLPSHGGDLGPEASARHRERWNRAQRVAAQFDAGFLTDRFGPLTQFSAGHPWERLKFVTGAVGERVLLKFAGLGTIGERKLEMARTLHAAGFTPEPVELVHGFLAERWCEGAKPLAADDKPIDEIARYITARAKLLPARGASGASIDELLTMCRRNISLAFGESAAGGLDRWDIADLSRRVARVRTDNKLDRPEWLRASDGRLLKTDALDHHCAHDLIGSQDPAWDVAGAIVEFELNDREAERLAKATAVDWQLLEFCLLAYCAFRIGHSSLSGQPRPQRYAHHVLQHASSSTRQESSVD